MDKVNEKNPCATCRWHLTNKQYIEISNRNRVAFRYQSDNARAYRGVSLTPFAFESLCEYISLHYQNNSEAMCLDKNLWLKCRDNDIFLASQPYLNCNMNQFFRFTHDMWMEYINKHHEDIHKALKEKTYKKAIMQQRKKSMRNLKKKKEEVKKKLK